MLPHLSLYRSPYHTPEELFDGKITFYDLTETLLLGRQEGLRRKR
jgi:hypothetical protein